jgi:uncharacterized protein YbcI
MSEIKPTMAQRVAQAASAFQQQRTGHAREAVTVALSGDTLLITLHGALTPAEQAMATTPVGAAQLQEFHRRLFADSAVWLRRREVDPGDPGGVVAAGLPAPRVLKQSMN